MAYEIVRSDEEIGKVVDTCIELEDDGKNPYWGMTYVKGFLDAIDWLTDKDIDHPFDHE